jgi:hypothetical protein
MDSMTSGACLINRPDRCKGIAITIDYYGPCMGPAHEPEPIEDVDDAGWWDR